VFLSVCYYCFFSDCRIYLFSSLAARVFNKLTRYSLDGRASDVEERRSV